MSLGILLGLIQLPIPGIGSVSMGVSPAMAVTFHVTQYVLRMATDDLLGVVSGVTGNPATLVYANKVVTSARRWRWPLL